MEGPLHMDPLPTASGVPGSGLHPQKGVLVMRLKRDVTGDGNVPQAEQNLAEWLRGRVGERS